VASPSWPTSFKPHDHTEPSDYTADAGDPGVEDLALEDVAGPEVGRGTP